MKAIDVATIEQREAILAALKGRFNRETTIGEIEAVRHAAQCIHNPAIFQSIVEPWFRAMTQGGVS